MKLLILTQKVDVNDDLLGFFHGWVRELAKHCEQITVICLYKGEFDLPENVKILSLGKEKLTITNSRTGRSSIASWFHGFMVKLSYCWRFYKFIWQERKNYDYVFVHMNNIYVLLGGLWWRLWRKKISLWYAHYQVNFQLKVAVWLSHRVVTSTAFACRLKSKKLKVVGQGIDTEYFRNLNYDRKDDKINLLFLGRISPVKDLETLVKALNLVKKDNDKVFLNIVGEPTEDDKEYFQKIKKMADDYNLTNIIKFHGRVSNRETLGHYNQNDIFINLTRTGSFDKTTLEAMACEKLVIVCNLAFEKIFSKEWCNLLIFKEGDEQDLAEKILNLIKLKVEDKKEIGEKLREVIKGKHSQKRLINKILALYKNGQTG